MKPGLSSLVLIGVCVALGSCTAPDSSALPALPAYPLTAAENLGVFDAPDRDQWQKPDLIMDDLSIADGSIVADLGAAPGWWAVRLSARVGPVGMIYAEDIQPDMIEAIRRRIQNERLQNVFPILGTPTDPRLPKGIDAALIVDTYPEIDDPVTLLRNVAAVLKPQGRLGIVDFTPGGGGPGPDRPGERVDAARVIEAASAAGLRLIANEPAGPFQYLLIFKN